MANDVIDLLTALRDGTMSIDDVASRFRQRTWPRRRRTPATTYLELAIRAQEDPEPYLPGSFDDVSAAFHRGDLSSTQYGVLAQAMADSVRAEDKRLDADANGAE
jgi:hypothetical protein